MKSLGSLIMVSVGVLASGFFARGAAHAALEDSRGQWEAAGIRDYEYRYQKYCDCHRDLPPETVVDVRDGRVSRVYHLHADSDREVPARDGSLDLYWTIDELFDLIDAATQRDAVVRVSYDDDLGYPTTIFIDYDPQAIGDELDVRLTELSVGAR
jgi:Family of unknown function (DUF6174)